MPAGGVDGQILRINVRSSNGTRTPAVASGVRLTTGLTARSLSVPNGEVGVFALEYSGLISAWILTAAAVTGT